MAPQPRPPPAARMPPGGRPAANCREPRGRKALLGSRRRPAGMSPQTAFEEEVGFRSMDGTALRGTLRAAPHPRMGVLFVHGITVDRDEDGFYSTFAARLDPAGATSLRFDLRAHGKSGGSYEAVTLSGVINDIGSAYGLLASRLPPGAPAFVVAASFGGGLSACWAAAAAAAAGRGAAPRGLVLLNPLLDYGRRMIFDKPYWGGGRLTDAGIARLSGRGWLDHGEFRIGPAMFNELLYMRPQDRTRDLDIPLLVIHGDRDSVVPYGTARRCAGEARDSEFVTVEGADHGFVHPDDEDCTHPDTLRFRDVVFKKVLEWAAARA